MTTTPKTSWPCDECACDVRPSDIARGAIRRLVEPDNAFGSERYETLCEVCAYRPPSADGDSPPSPTPIRVERTCDNDRGLNTYTQFVDSYGARVTVRDSSNAGTDAVWVFVEGGSLTVNDGSAHLDAAQARAVRDALDLWLSARATA